MTWEQYLQWQTAMRNHIGKRQAERRLAGGSNVIVNGRMISIMVSPEELERAAEEPVWKIVVYGRIRVIGIGALPSQDWTEWSGCCGILRATGALWSNAFWEGTQQFYITESEDPEFEPFGRGVELDLQVRSSVQAGPGITPTPFEQALYRVPVRLTLEEAADDVVFRNHTFDLRRSGQRQTFMPEESNVFYTLSPSLIEPL